MQSGPHSPAFPPERFLTFYGPINTPATTSLRAALCEMLNQGATAVSLLFASAGGSVEDGISLFTYLRAIPLEITMHASGVVASAAIPVFLAASKRFASNNAIFVFHDYNWTFPAGPADHMTITESSLRLTSHLDWTKSIVKAETKLTDGDFERMKLFEQPKVFSAAEAAEKGIVQGIAEPRIPANSQPRVVC